MRAGRQTPPDQIDASDLIRTVFRRLPKILLISALMGGLAYLVSAMKAPSYQSEAELKIVAKGSSNALDPKRDGASPDSTIVQMDKEAVNTHVRALQSADLGAAIASEMKLASKVEFNSALGAPDQLSAILRLVGIGLPRAGETEEDRVESEYVRRLEVYSPKESRLIGIRFTSSDADLASNIANRLAEVYREKLAAKSQAQTDQVQQVLEPKIAQLKAEVIAAAQEVERFKGEANIFKGGQGATGLNEQQLAELTGEQMKAKAARSEADARLKSAREMVKAGSAEALPDVQKSPLITNLIQQRVRLERQISENAVANLPGHPVSRKLEADLAGLRRQISGEIAKIADGIDKEAKIAALREDSITKSLNEVKQRVVTTSPDQVKLAALEATAKSKSGELERLEREFEANRIKADSRSVGVEAEIVTVARPSSVPISPKKLANALLVSTATLLMALALVVTRGLLAGVGRQASPAPYTKSAGRRASDANRSVEPPIAAAPAPFVPAKVSPAPIAVVDASKVSERPAAPKSGKVASLEDMGDRVFAAAKGPQGFRTLIAAESASMVPGPEAVGLANALAGKGKAVLLIDWALNGTSIVGDLGLPPDPGLAGLLGGRSTFEDIIRAVPASDVHIITAGSKSAGLPDMNDAQKLNLLLDALDEAYDHIIVACPLEDARQLFEATEGRFDAGITLTTFKRRVSALDGAQSDNGEMFLGFDVADILLLQSERSVASSAASGVARVVRPKFNTPAAVPARR
jgi:polysaccharide biosynthesis transport protein